MTDAEEKTADIFVPTEFPQIVFEDNEWVVLFKPARWYVHPPENKRYRRLGPFYTLTDWLKQNRGAKFSPAHRIDSATEGLVIFGKNKEATARVNEQFRAQEVSKTYYAVIRGWMTPGEGLIDKKLELDSTGEEVECFTKYKTLSHIELPYQVNSRFDSTRYALIQVSPLTGRWHQIRRHFNRVAHPLIGDREHGDSHHNRFFRDQLGVNGLCLWAHSLELEHPRTGEGVKFVSPQPQKWVRIEELFKIRLG